MHSGIANTLYTKHLPLTQTKKHRPSLANHAWQCCPQTSLREFHCKCAPFVVKSLMSLLNRPFIFLQTFLPDRLSSDSSPELSLSATNRSTQPSGRGSRELDSSYGFIRLAGFFEIDLSGPASTGGASLDTDDDGSG